MKAYYKEYEFAKKLVVEVGNFVAKQQEKTLTLKKKADGEFYTVIDIAAEEKIKHAIESRYPQDNILAEETVNKTTAEERLWIIDPIDGTHQFSIGEDSYSIIIGFWDKGKMQLGVVYQPATKKLYHAARGNGAYCNEKKIQPTKEEDLKKLLVIKALWFDRAQNTLDNGLRVLKRVMQNCLDERRYGSCGLDCCRVSSGRAGAYYEFNLKQWDVAGPSIIAEEAGCIVSDISGNPLSIISQRSINLLVCANTNIHKKMLEILNHE